MRKPSADAALLGGLALAIVVAAYPAWTGDWIYDDWPMRVNERMDGWEDALRVFARSSVDYLGANAASHAGAVTYRPLSMLSLIVVQVVFPDAPLAHHALSLLLHLANTALLFGILRATAGSHVASLAALVFGLHPLGIEAYGWINGRSDVLAALGVLLTARALLVPAQRARHALALAGSVAAVLSKETALFALLGVVGAALMPLRRGSPEPASWRVPRAAWMASIAGVALAMVARALALGDIKRTAMSLGALPDLPRGLTRLVAVMVESVLVPLPRTMPNLGQRLAQPLDGSQMVLLLIALAALGALARRGYLRATLLMLTAFALLLPCIVVRHAFWLGGDRYLYVPLALAGLALGSSALPARLQALRPSVRSLAASTAALLLGVSTFLTAQTYHSQTDHMLAMMRMRPDDPSGYLIGARWLWHRGQKPGALELLASVPRSGLAPPLASQLATVLGEMGETSDALAVVADMEQRYPHDPYVALDVISVRLDQGRVTAAQEKASALRTKGGFCQSVRATFTSHLSQPAFERAHGEDVRAFLRGYACR